MKLYTITKSKEVRESDLEWFSISETCFTFTDIERAKDKMDYIRNNSEIGWTDKYGNVCGGRVISDNDGYIGINNTYQRNIILQTPFNNRYLYRLSEIETDD